LTAAGVAANLGGVALMTVPGLGLTELLAPLRRLPWPRRLGYAFLLGVGALGAGLFAASHLAGVPLRRPVIVWTALAPAALGAAACVARRRRGAADTPARREADAGAGGTWPQEKKPPVTAAPETGAAATAVPAALAPPAARAETAPSGPAPERPAGLQRRAGHRLRLALGLAVAVALAGPLISALTSPLADWDGRMTWGPLAAYLRQEGTVDAEVLRDAHWLVLHPRYPPLLPLAQEAIQELFGAGQDDQYFRALYVAFLGALLTVVFDGAKRAAGRRAAELTVLCAALPPFLSYGGGGATSAYSDMPLAAFYGGALVLLLAWPPRVATGFAAGCLLAAGVLTKNEGELLAAAALVLAASRLGWRGSRGSHGSHGSHGSRRSVAAGRHLAWLGAAALPVLAAAALLASWRAAIPNREDEDYFAGLRLGDLVHGAASRLSSLAGTALRLTFMDWTWLGFWVVFVVVVLAGRRALARPLAWRLAVAGLVPVAIGCAAYAVSTRPGPLIDETWQRFLLQGWVPFAAVFACALASLLAQLPGGAWRPWRRRLSP
jgi:hypothetical protein